MATPTNSVDCSLNLNTRQALTWEITGNLRLNHLCTKGSLRSLYLLVFVKQTNLSSAQMLASVDGVIGADVVFFLFSFAGINGI